MKGKLLVLIYICWNGLLFSQPKITFVADVDKVITNKTVANANFNTFNNPINKGFNKGVYWFKIGDFKEKIIVQFPNNHLSEGVSFYKNERKTPENKERFLTFIVEEAPTFIKINVTKEAYIPITIHEYSAYRYTNKIDHLYTGFYYGFAFVIILINLFYFINFRDITFLYYALFLFGVSASFLISDGMLKLLDVSQSIIDSVTLIIHIVTSLIGAFFATSYLQANTYYPRLRIAIASYIAVQTVLFIMYLTGNAFIYYALIETVVFVLLGVYWLTSLFLFSKNVFTKIFTIAYVFIFLLGVDFYVLKLYGFELLQISRDYIKMAGFFEMILLSFAVIYRMKTLHQENLQMRNEITQYATQIASLSDELKKNRKGEVNYFTEFDLSEREQEIFMFLTQGKSNKEIGAVLFISVNTVKYHIKKIYSKLKIKNRKEVKKITQV